MIQHYNLQPVLSRLLSQMNSSLDDYLYKGGDTNETISEWSPSVDVVEYNDRFELYADIPGISANAIDISLENNVLIISGERTKFVSSDEQRHAQIERPLGKFHRQFVLPNVVDSRDITASSHDGVLQIIIKKKEQAKARKIEVFPMH